MNICVYRIGSPRYHLESKTLKWQILSELFQITNIFTISNLEPESSNF